MSAPASEIALALDDAVQNAAVMTVVLDSGRRWLGVLREHPTEPSTYVVRTGSRGRPPVFHREDVESVIFE
ncbi:hypothetical protein ACFVGV_05990 [Pseudarthrobacter scleromae]|uniref:hypothetical protein n=1 Tax=Pseudarthrobacter scleromae TaxID=158897 RepID=UPI0036368579